MTTLVVVPILNEHAVLCQQLKMLDVLRAMGAHVLLVDGGSTDQSIPFAKASGFDVLESEVGRARQMNAGANASASDYLIFLHVDTTLSAKALSQIEYYLDGSAKWGRCDVRIVGRSFWLKVISFCMNTRARVTGIATGDQAIFMSREIFDQVGGFPEQPLMEDIEMSKRLKRICSPVCITERLDTSGRRWEQYGVWRTILLMWRLRWGYWRGVPASELARQYR